MVNTREVAEIGNGRIEEEQYTKYMSIFNLELNLWNTFYKALL